MNKIVATKVEIFYKKRIADIILSAGFFLISAALIYPLAAFLIWLNGSINDKARGPIMFIQDRVGLHGKVFKMYKLRTMEVEPTDGGRKNLTTIGYILRKWHLDEFPQLWNVLKGEMSMVGPRPIPEKLDIMLAKKYQGWNARKNILPGLTSEGVLKNSDKQHDDLWLAEDINYIKNESLYLYFKAIADTIKYFFRSSRYATYRIDE
ncbi:MAG: sugar transferase [Candidatus Margulisbacteria bacterium]|nr:sugar transferase [Candidatus Margulisiibacteriota bacterium]